MSSKANIVASFIGDAPPGQLSNILDDIKALTPNDPQLVQGLSSAFRKYNEEQFAVAELSESQDPVIICSHISLDPLTSDSSSSTYYDPLTSKAFTYDHTKQSVITNSIKSHNPSPANQNLLTILSTTLQTYTKEHQPTSLSSRAVGVFPSSSTSTSGQKDDIILLTVSNRYSLANFWSGRWRSSYTFSPSTETVKGWIKVDVHYFEDGNVRMTTGKDVEFSVAGDKDKDEEQILAEKIVKGIALEEKKYQEEVYKTLTRLNEDIFKGLRRQLPVTRQRVDWAKVGGYRVGQDIGSSSSHNRWIGLRVFRHSGRYALQPIIEIHPPDNLQGTVSSKAQSLQVQQSHGDDSWRWLQKGWH